MHFNNLNILIVYSFKRKLYHVQVKKKLVSLLKAWNNIKKFFIFFIYTTWLLPTLRLRSSMYEERIKMIGTNVSQNVSINDFPMYTNEVAS